MTYKEFLKEKIGNMTSDDSIELYNEIEDSDYIYQNDEYFMDETFSSPNDAVRAVCYGNYEYMDTYVMFESDGNLKSGNHFSDFIDDDEFVDFLSEHDYARDKYEINN